MGLFQVLAAILHLGNVEIKDRDADSSIIPVRITEILQYLWHACFLYLIFNYTSYHNEGKRNPDTQILRYLNCCRLSSFSFKDVYMVNDNKNVVFLKLTL